MWTLCPHDREDDLRRGGEVDRHTGRYTLSTDEVKDHITPPKDGAARRIGYRAHLPRLCPMQPLIGVYSDIIRERTALREELAYKHPLAALRQHAVRPRSKAAHAEGGADGNAECNRQAVESLLCERMWW